MSSCFGCQFWFGCLRGNMPPLYRWKGSLFMWVEAFHVRKADYLILLSDMGVTSPFYPPIVFGLAYHTQFHDWLHPSWGSLSASINRYRHHSLCLTYMFLLKSAAKSHYLWSSPILSGCSGRHPLEKPQLPVFPPQGSFTGRSSGDHLTTFLLWCPLFITSDRGSLAWGGAGTPVLCMTAAYTQENANL